MGLAKDKRIRLSAVQARFLEAKIEALERRLNAMDGPPSAQVSIPDTSPSNHTKAKTPVLVFGNQPMLGFK